MEANVLKYTKEHEWVYIDGDTATIGITDYAQEELGDIVFVELPADGDSVDEGDSPVTLESVKAVSSVYTPFSGTILEVNSILDDKPETINSSPLDDGWIFKIKISGSKKEPLMSFDEYTEYLKTLD